MPFIAMRRTDIPNGVLQVLDLWPNTSLRNQIYDPIGQTKYINRLQNDTLLALSANVTTATFVGLGAYLIDHVIKNSTNTTISVANANTVAGNIISAVNAGTTLTLATINGFIQAATGDVTSSLTAGGSNGTLADVLKICGGAIYTLPAGSLVGGLAAPANLGSLGSYLPTYDTGALAISFGSGSLAQFTSASFDYLGTTGAALVVYADDGSVYV